VLIKNSGAVIRAQIASSLAELIVNALLRCRCHCCNGSIKGKKSTIFHGHKSDWPETKSVNPWLVYFRHSSRIHFGAPSLQRFPGLIFELAQVLPNLMLPADRICSLSIFPAGRLPSHSAKSFPSSTFWIFLLFFLSMGSFCPLLVCVCR